MKTRAFARFAGAVALSAIAAVAFATTASAHVTVTPATSPAAGYTVVTLKVPHGCDGAATKELAVRLPQDASSVKAEQVPGWEVTYTMKPLAKPVVTEGTKVTDYVDTITWTASDSPLPDNLYRTFGIALKTPDQPGATIMLPTSQRCVGGHEVAWIDTTEAGAHPAPSFALGARAVGDGDMAPEPAKGHTASKSEKSESSSGEATDLVARALIALSFVALIIVAAAGRRR